MPATLRFAAGAACLLLASPALAQITAEDVWASQTGLWQAAGVRPLGSLVRDGNRVVVTGAGGEYRLPLDLGHVSWRTSDIVMTDNPDGTVDIDIGPEMTVSIVAELTEMPDFYLMADLGVKTQGWLSVASGSPGDIVTRTAFDMMMVESRQITLTGVGQDAADYDLLFSFQGLESETRVAGASPITLEAGGRIARTITDTGLTADGLQTRSVSVTEDTAYRTSVILPDVPLNLLDLSPALRAGLSIDLEGTAGLTQSQTVTRSSDDIIVDQAQSAAGISQTLRLSEEGLSTDLRAETLFNRLIGLTGNQIPFVLRLGAAEMAFAMPLLAAPGAQDARLRLALTDMMAEDESLIALGIDPAGLNAPASVLLDLSARIEVLHDLPDLMGLADRTDAGQPVLRVFGVNLDALEARYAAAALAGSGSVTWGEAGALLDTTITPPAGEARFVLDGGYATLDSVASAGLVPRDVMIGLRGLLSGFGRPVGPDRLESTVTLAPDGALRINGAPIPF